MVVSLPEKTLEHWASLYLTYRYRSHASLWWPAHGEDVHVGYLPPRSGKAVQLELKTTYLNARGDVHEVRVSLEQLDKYLRRSHWMRPFYVFPIPDWIGTLESAATANKVSVTELGFSRSDAMSLRPWWFARWLVALTTDEVAEILLTQLAAYRAGGGSRATLVTVDFSSGHRVTRWGDGRSHNVIAWQDLWTQLDGCGRSSWPQIVRLPSLFMERRARVRHADVFGLLANGAGMDGEFTTLGSTGEGTFEPLPEQQSREDRPALPDMGDAEPDHRIVVFLRM
jgi:hypothetical protein